MDTQQLHRGRLIDHIQLVVDDLPASLRFYKAIFEVLGIPISGATNDHFWADELFISSTQSAEAQGRLTGRHHIAFQAKDRDTVKIFYKVALENGGTDNGAPGVRSYHPSYFAAFVIDPHGNNIEAVHHGTAKRSSASVKIEFEG